MKYKFKIKGLDCANCALELEEKISKLKDIKSVSINFISQNIFIESNINKDTLVKKLEKIIKEEEPGVELVDPTLSNGNKSIIKITVSFVSFIIALLVPFKSDYRILSVKKYLIFYRIDESDVYVDRILHSRRNYIRILFGR